MATAVEYAMVATLISIAGIAVVNTVWDEGEAPLAATCTAASINQSGLIRLSCPGQVKGLRLHLKSSTLAIAQAANPRPMSCLLYEERDPECVLEL